MNTLYITLAFYIFTFHTFHAKQSKFVFILTKSFSFREKIFVETETEAQFLLLFCFVQNRVAFDLRVSRGSRAR